MQEPTQRVAFVSCFNPFRTAPCQGKQSGVGIAKVAGVAQAQFEDRTWPCHRGGVHGCCCESHAWSLSICGLRRLRAGRRRVAMRSSTVLSTRSRKAEYRLANGDVHQERELLPLKRGRQRSSGLEPRHIASVMASLMTWRRSIIAAWHGRFRRGHKLARFWIAVRPCPVLGEETRVHSRFAGVRRLKRARGPTLELLDHARQQKCA